MSARSEPVPLHGPHHGPQRGLRRGALRGRAARAAALAVLAGLTVGVAGCRSQRWPKPMTDTVDPLPPGDTSPYDPGPAEAIVFRHGDPVQVRRAGTRAGYPLTYYDKRARVLSGGWMLVGPGGRGEVFWSDNGTVAVFFDQGSCRIGEPTRGEPDLDVRDLSSLRLNLGAGARIRLPGGAELDGDPVAGGGPYDVRRVGERLIRVRNQSKTALALVYRHEDIQLGPGDVIDLAVLQTGDGALPPVGEDWTAAEHVLVRGEVQRLEAAGAASGDPAVGLRAVTAAEVIGQGVRVHLAPGESATFRGLGDPARGFSRKGPATDDPSRDDLRIRRIEPLPEPEPAAVPIAPSVPSVNEEPAAAAGEAEAEPAEAPMIPAPPGEEPAEGAAPGAAEPTDAPPTAGTPGGDASPGAPDAEPDAPGTGSAGGASDSTSAPAEPDPPPPAGDRPDPSAETPRR